MKITFVIAEYNPFHTGHLFQLRAVKLIAGAMANAVIEGREGRMGAAAVEEETAE